LPNASAARTGSNANGKADVHRAANASRRLRFFAKSLRCVVVSPPSVLRRSAVASLRYRKWKTFRCRFSMTT
jgi:hypothetical protein